MDSTLLKEDRDRDKRRGEMTEEDVQGTECSS